MKLKLHQKTKVYVIFSSTGLDHRGSWDTADIEQKVIKNEEILSELEKRCEGVEFVGKINIINEEEMELISRFHYGMTEEERNLISEIHENSRRRYECQDSILMLIKEKDFDIMPSCSA